MKILSTLGITTRRGIAVAGVLASLAVTAVAPASTKIPPGRGLDSTFGPFQCEGMGSVTIVAPTAVTPVPTGWTSTGEHAVALWFGGRFTDLEGNVFEFTKSFGRKAGMTPFTCTAHYEYPEGIEDFTMAVAIVPAAS